jgi:hypothetical protein
VGTSQHPSMHAQAKHSQAELSQTGKAFANMVPAAAVGKSRHHYERDCGESLMCCHLS